jgi:hypothetical protein
MADNAKTTRPSSDDSGIPDGSFSSRYFSTWHLRVDEEREGVDLNKTNMAAAQPAFVIDARTTVARRHQGEPLIGIGIAMAVGSYNALEARLEKAGQPPGWFLLRGVAALRQRFLLDFSEEGNITRYRPHPWFLPEAAPAPAAAAPVVTPAAAPAAAPVVTAAPAAPTVHQSAALAAALTEDGFAVRLPKLWTPDTVTGEALTASGEATVRRMVQQYEQRPKALTAVRKFEAVIGAEERQYVDADVSSLRFEGAGMVSFEDRQGKRKSVALEPRVLGALSGRFARIMPGGLRALRSYLGGAGSSSFADLLSDRFAEADSYGYGSEAQRMRFGVRTLPGQAHRSLFLAGSAMYMPMDPAQFLRVLVQASGGDDMRLDLSYNADSTVTRWGMHDHAAADTVIAAGVGGVFKVGSEGVTADAGNRNFQSRLVMYRLQCLNMMVSSGAIDGGLNVIHRAGRADWARMQRRAAHRVADAGRTHGREVSRFVGAFRRSWGAATADVIGERGNLTEELALIGGLLSSRSVGIKLPTEALSAAWGATRAEDSERSTVTRADVMNVATWAATHGLLDDLAAWKVREQSAVLLHATA